MTSHAESTEGRCFTLCDDIVERPSSSSDGVGERICWYEEDVDVVGSG